MPDSPGVNAPTQASRIPPFDTIDLALVECFRPTRGGSKHSDESFGSTPNVGFRVVSVIAA